MSHTISQKNQLNGNNHDKAATTIAATPIDKLTKLVKNSSRIISTNPKISQCQGSSYFLGL